MASRIRLYRPDRNPLRRGTDRIEALSVALFLLMFVAGIGLALHAGRMVYDDGVRSELGGRWVTARLMQDAPQPTLAPYEGGATMTRAKATWTDVDGRPVTATVPVRWGAKAGTTTKVWVDASGRVAPGPPQRIDTIVRTIAVGLTVVLLSATVTLGGYAGVRALLDRRRYADWDAAWLIAEREWRRRKQV
nr:MAG: hypothetical protein DIU60_20185 [Actinomycetota bacterium]